jgi:hypothetical protein
MHDMKDRIRQTLLQSRLYKDFSTLTNEIMKKEDAGIEALERANYIMEDEAEELAEQLHQLMKT